MQHFPAGQVAFLNPMFPLCSKAKTLGKLGWIGPSDEMSQTEQVDVLPSICDESGRSPVSRPLRELRVFACLGSISRQRPEVFSHFHTPPSNFGKQT